MQYVAVHCRTVHCIIVYCQRVSYCPASVQASPVLPSLGRSSTRHSRGQAWGRAGSSCDRTGAGTRLLSVTDHSPPSTPWLWRLSKCWIGRIPPCLHVKHRRIPHLPWNRNFKTNKRPWTIWSCLGLKQNLCSVFQDTQRNNCYVFLLFLKTPCPQSKILKLEY